MRIRLPPFTALLVLPLLACGGGEGGTGTGPPPPGGAPDTTTAVVAANGATLTLDTTALVALPAGVLQIGTALRLSRSAPTMRSLVVESAPLFAEQPQASVAFVLSYQGNTQPVGNVAVTLRVPDDFLAATVSEQLALYVSSVSEGDNETIPLLVPIEASFDSATASVTTVIPPWAFTDDVVQGRLATTFVVGTVLPGAVPALPAVRPSRLNAGCTEPLILSPMFMRLAPTPLQSWSPHRTRIIGGVPVTKPHAGTDYSTGLATALFAAESGSAYWRVDPLGYGTYVIIDHGGGRKTLYAHLSGLAGSLRGLPQSTVLSSGLQVISRPVQKGDSIAFSGNSGPPNTQIHLHLEYGTGAPTPVTSNALKSYTVDPDPCLQYIHLLTVNPDPLSLPSGGTGTLSALAQDGANAPILGLHYLWATSTSLVATVGNAGQVTIATNAAGGASATISASSGGKRGTATVNVSGVRGSFQNLAAGGNHTCGLTSGGAAYCWGHNYIGQLGDGTTTPRATPVLVTGGLTFASLTAGGDHTCGLTVASVAYCWGDNSFGQLGDGTMTARTSPAPVAGGLVFTRLTSGVVHTCGLISGGAAYCWGDNAAGKLGDGTMTTRTSPVLVAGSLVFGSLTLGVGHTCGLTLGGGAYCWGHNSDGQLGDGTTTDRTTPVPAAGALGLVSLTVGFEHACGLVTANSAYCWGDNFYGQLGDGTTTDRSTPVPVTGGLVFASLSADADAEHTCGLTAAGAAYCWGWNVAGELGDGTATTRTSPVPVAGGLAFGSLALGGAHTCGLTTGGIAYCWGLNAGGSLGDGTTTPRWVPTPVIAP